MGNFFGSIQIRTQDAGVVRSVVSDLAEKERLRFLIGPPIAGWVAVYPDNNGQDPGISSKLASRLADCDVLHCTVSDDDAFAYWFYVSGKLVDQYSSAPEDMKEGHPPSARDHAQVFAHLLDASRLQALEQLLAARRFTFEMNRLEQFGGLLGLPNVLSAYEYLREGERDGIKRWKEFVHIPDRSGRKAAIRKELKRLRAEGILWVDEREPKGSGGYSYSLLDETWCVDPATGSVYLRWKGSQSSDGSWRCFRGPKWLPQECDLPLDPSIHAARFSATGRFLLRYCYGRPARLSIWDRQESRWAKEYEGGLVAFAISTDEKRLFISENSQFLNIHSLSVTEDASEQIKHSFENRTCRTLAPHPEGRWLALDFGMWLGLLDLENPDKLRPLAVGGAHDFGPAMTKQLENLQGKLSELEKELPAEQFQYVRQLYEAQLNASRQTEPQPLEHVVALAFTPDGSWLICGTNKGIRIFEWAKLLEPAGSQIPWTFSVEAENFIPEDDQDDFGIPQLHAFALDSLRKRVLFSGAEGKLKYFEFERNRSGDLLVGPETSPISRISLLPDRSGLVVTRRPETRNREEQRQKFQIWNYAALCRAAGLEW